MFEQFYYWFMSYTPAKSATEQIDAVLSGFTEMVDKLTAAIAAAEDEIDASNEREEVAYMQFVETRESEQFFRDDVEEALSKAETARANIAALVGE